MCIRDSFCAEKGIAIEGSVDAWSQEKMMEFIEEHQIPCPTCGKHNFTDIRQFNLMFKTFQGAVSYTHLIFICMEIWIWRSG